MRTFFVLALLLTLPNEAGAGSFRAEGPVGNFILRSELRTLPMPIKAAPLTYGGLKAKEIAITIDDGPDPVGTPAVLAILREHGVKATFFLQGVNVKRYPKLVLAILKDGHAVANHTWNHIDLSKASLEEMRSQIQRTDDVLRPIVEGAGYRVQPFFRFPFGAGANDASRQALLESLGLANFYWSMSAHDSRTKDPNECLNTAVGMIDKYKRGIFLMHDTHHVAVKMLPYFLEELFRRGYTTVHYEALR